MVTLKLGMKGTETLSKKRATIGSQNPYQHESTLNGYWLDRQVNNGR